jgi:hypothetical protein
MTAAVHIRLPEIRIEHAVLALDGDTVPEEGAEQRRIFAVRIVQTCNDLSTAIAESGAGGLSGRWHVLVGGPCRIADVLGARVPVVPYILRVTLGDALPVMAARDLTVASILAPRCLEQLELADAVDAGHLPAPRVYIIR